MRESEYAESRADFVHQLRIAIKEANETQYWLELLHQADYINKKVLNQLIKTVLKS
ncbi:four helix bundle protein [Okeania sp. KiyG1]|uniref:four helix bundle protein n=1 Tax=Okeania sp. KiyG1 TaxID=2720165 RepID=UPI00199BE085|nr:four helix bundle protein [Okeania sp. KiyG1]GGA11717.1 hypothetical protein CYANOKiyG1_24750 [Okeania sp. KiyG1]